MQFFFSCIQNLETKYTENGQIQTWKETLREQQLMGNWKILRKCSDGCRWREWGLWGCINRPENVTSQQCLPSWWTDGKQIRTQEILWGIKKGHRDSCEGSRKDTGILVRDQKRTLGFLWVVPWGMEVLEGANEPLLFLRAQESVQGWQGHQNCPEELCSNTAWAEAQPSTLLLPSLHLASFLYWLFPAGSRR